MIIIVAAIKDRLADCYAQPMYFPTEGMAVRAFQDALADSGNNLSKHPDDYDLCKLGTFDDATGRFTNVEIPTVLALGKQHKPQ